MPASDPKARIRASIALSVAPAIAECLLQWCKANPAFKLADLRDDDERAIFYAAVIDHLFTPATLHDVTEMLNASRSQAEAVKGDDAETIARQARQDIQKYGRGTGSVN